MDDQKYLIRYGCNDFVFEGPLHELTDILISLEQLTPVILSSAEDTYEETGLKKRLRIYTVKEQPRPESIYTHYTIAK